MQFFQDVALLMVVCIVVVTQYPEEFYKIILLTTEYEVLD